MRIIEVDGKRANLQIWDTAGQERFMAISRSHYRGAHAAVLCYNINNRESFEKIGYWMEEVRKYSNKEDVCFVIVGTKSDLQNKRVVSIDEGRQLAESLEAKFFETSAKENLNVDEAFWALAKDVGVVLNKQKNDAKEVGIQLNPRENNPQIQINCFKCS